MSTGKLVFDVADGLIPLMMKDARDVQIYDSIVAATVILKSASVYLYIASF